MSGRIRHPAFRRPSAATEPAERRLNVARVSGTSSPLRLTVIGELDAERESRLIARMVNSIRRSDSA